MAVTCVYLQKKRHIIVPLSIVLYLKYKLAQS